jgi:hypothetical protein
MVYAGLPHATIEREQAGDPVEDEASSDEDPSDSDIGCGESGWRLKYVRPRDLY